MPRVDPVTIDHLSGTPVYVQLAELLRASIERGELRAGPAAAVLHDADAGARGSAAARPPRRCSVLVGEGLVKIVPGRGACIVTKPGERP